MAVRRYHKSSEPGASNIIATNPNPKNQKGSDNPKNILKIFDKFFIIEQINLLY